MMLELGSTIFVRTAAADVFAVGTIEAIDPQSYDVSYPDLNNGRRGTPTATSLDQCINPTSIAGSTPLANETTATLSAGSVHMCSLDAVRFRLVRFLAVHQPF